MSAPVLQRRSAEARDLFRSLSMGLGGSGLKSRLHLAVSCQQAINGNPVQDVWNIRAFQVLMRRLGLSNRIACLLLPTPIADFLQRVQDLRRPYRSGFSARAVSGVRDGKPAKLWNFPTRSRRLRNWPDMRWAQPAPGVVGHRYAGGVITSIRQAPPRRPGMAERGGYRIMGSKARCVRARICC